MPAKKGIKKGVLKKSVVDDQSPRLLEMEKARMRLNPRGWSITFPTLGPHYFKESPDIKVAWTRFSPGAEISIGKGTKTNRRLIQPFLNTLPEKEREKWITGHLISHSFSGNGEVRDNIVPLTRRANSLHQNYVESAVERNQRTIRRYFCQPAVRWYGRIVAVLKYSVRACGVNKLGVPKLLRCTITYEYKIRSANCIGETEGWKEAKWQKSHDAAHLVSMINGDCDIVADICDSGVYVRRMESLSDSSSISNPIHNC